MIYYLTLVSQYKETLHKNTVKLFADYAIRRKEIEEKEARIKKREREEEIKEEDKSKKAKEWQKDWEVRSKYRDIDCHERPGCFIGSRGHGRMCTSPRPHSQALNI